MSSVLFLQKVYEKQCSNGDYIILSVKGPNIKWKDVSIEYQENTIKQKLTEFFNTYPDDNYDLYFSPMPYSEPRRKIENSLDTKYLAQDIDEHENPNDLNPKPTFLWESSPDKYQGMWELDRYIEEDEYTPLNKALAKHIGCDDCFDFCHVYRIPGTTNHKYKNNPKVDLPITSKIMYKPKVLKRKINYKEKKQTENTMTVSNSNNLTERKIYAKYNIPQKVKELLAVDDITSIDRSNTIWYIENKLHELGMEPNEIIHLIRNSEFNKYKGRHDEIKRLRNELDKIIGGEIENSQSDNKSKGRKLKVSSYQDVMGNSSSFEGWLVKGFWGRRSHGIVAGMPKCFKSTLMHDLVISVASGKPFLGKYPVEEPGPVIVVQNENADYIMKDRSEKIVLHRGLEGEIEHKSKSKLGVTFPVDLPISFINQQGFLLTNEEDRKCLEDMIAEKRPVLVVLDPLYLMFDGDLNSAKELNPVLNWLLYIKTTYKTSIMLIHHYNKGGATQGKGGSRMMGSVFLYGWVESAWYLSKEESDEPKPQIQNQHADQHSKEPAVVTMNREFRMAAPYPEIDIHLSMGPMGDPSYDIDVTLTGETKVNVTNMSQDIINVLTNVNKPMSRRSISEAVGYSQQVVKKVLDDLIIDKSIITKGGGYTVYKGYSN